MQVFYLDVGQAESTLLAGPGFTILIDVGDWGRTDVSDHLHRLGVQMIDLLILTHPHADHLGQAIDVLKTFEVREVWMSGYEHSTKLFMDVLGAILDSDADYYEPRSGEKHDFGELTLEILNPAAIGRDLHDTNLVIRAVFGEIAFLFTGDAEKKTEDSMLSRASPLRAQILQLGHHGSRTSSSLNFLLAVRPEVAIYSAGATNDYGHPHSEVINRLRILEIPAYGTDVHGTLLVRTDGAQYDLLKAESGETPGKLGSLLSNAPADGRIDLNSASLLDLQRIIHIGPQRAQEILELRAVRPLRNVDDLKWVSGLNQRRIADIKQQGLAYVKGVMED